MIKDEFYNFHIKKEDDRYIVHFNGKDYPVTITSSLETINPTFIAIVTLEDPIKKDKFEVIGFGNSTELAIEDIELMYQSWQALGSPQSDVLVESIPKGHYCYSHENGKQKNCPFWSKNPEHGEQNDGFCGYLNKGDWQNDHPLGLLWDQVKECGINMPSNEDIKGI